MVKVQIAAGTEQVDTTSEELKELCDRLTEGMDGEIEERDGVAEGFEDAAEEVDEADVEMLSDEATEQLEEATEAYVGAGLEVARLQDEAADIKEELKGALATQKALGKTLRGLRGEGEGDDVNGSNDSNSSPQAWDVESEEWGKVSTRDLGLSNIDGAGPKKLVMIYEKCPTVGDIEELRAGEGLTSLKGIGEQLASDIEARLLEFLSKTRDREAFEEVEK